LINAAGAVVEAILLLGGLLLAVIYLVASLTKLNDQAGFKQTLVDSGIPLSFANPLSVLLPFAEPPVGAPGVLELFATNHKESSLPVKSR
jgi:uncharacterized membrane protein YphA (DoxX/SURF4 family)